ncbi:uncharacterized protein LOC118800483 [Colossoma macropomum]|uniref:uncharacterized protein LOC118800483 n=1 Tax=Colossoma macropomum TaxID=42526 RepID=UPI0018640AD9|nr:uncharacterized protein LOC118800483 [Colossoma macropomum]
MQSCSSALCILILLTNTFTTVFESSFPSVEVNLHDSATLSCSERCSGLVRWSVLHKPTDTLAECDQTSCRSKEGYQMIHDQYLKENLSLTITDADFSKRGRYTCDCDGKELCDVQLLIEPLNTSLQINPGESLVLDLEIPEEVEVIYNSTGAAGPSSGQICAVDGRSLQCKLEYKQRVSAALQLRGVTPSDSGVYTVMDKRNEEVIHIYTVTVGSAGGSDKVKGDHPDLDTDRGAAVPVWVAVLIVLVAVLVAVIVVLVVVIVRQRRENQQLQVKIERLKVELNGHQLL